MIRSIGRINDGAYRNLEASLLPTQGGLVKKVALYAYQLFKFVLFIPICAITSFFHFIASRFSKKAPQHPLIEFAKHPVWAPLRATDASPVEVGFATAGFQEDGYSAEATRWGPKGHPNTNWGQFYHNHPDAPQIGTNDPNFWGNPYQFIERLRDLKVNHFRFSIDRDRIQPDKNGAINRIALDHYRDIIRLCKANGIEPMITLVHFCDPSYFSWDRKEDVPGLVSYASAVCDMLADEGVQKVVTINEPTVVAFQGWVMGKFPPHRKMDFAAAGRVLENMMSAHTAIYKTVKARHPEIQIGLSHDPIRFRHYHKWNPLFSPTERLICHYLTEINHGVFMRYLQTGKFELKVPFRANHCFQTERPPMDFIGLQYYSDPLLRIGLTKGDSVTRVPGEKLSSYRFRMYPQGLASALHEFSSLKIPIEITEIGMDTGVNKDRSDAQRIQYFGRVFQVIQKALEHNIPVRSCYFWTCNDNREWHEGSKVKFGFHHYNWQTGEITPRPVVEWLKRCQAMRASAQARDQVA